MKKTGKQAPCFALVRGKCSALTVTDCQGCGFYKTRQDARRGRKKALLRIQSLDEDVKDHIIDKYFDKAGV